MGRRGGVIKSKVIRQAIGNKEVLDVFGMMTGEGSLGVRYPKYNNIHAQCMRFVKIIEVFASSSVMELFPESQAEIAAYYKKLKDDLAGSFNAPDLSAYLEPSGEEKSSVPGDLAESFVKVYDACSKSFVANSGLMTCNNLVTYKAHISEEDKLSDRFMTKSSMAVFKPFEGCGLNFKKMYIDMRLDEENRSFLMLVLHKTYNITHDLYEALSAPDQDIEGFIQIVYESLEQMHHHPQLHRCKDAFKAMGNSVGLLRENYGSYHKDFVASGNQSIMLENFILDVKDKHADGVGPKVSSQFTKIIKVFREETNNKRQDPKLRSLFTHVDGTFQELERKERKADAGELTDSDDSDEETSGQE